MTLSFTDLLHGKREQKPKVPLGSKVVIGDTQHKVEKHYRGLTGTVVRYGHPASVYDHLVHIDQWDENRWFKTSEFASVEEQPPEEPDVHSEH